MKKNVLTYPRKRQVKITIINFLFFLPQSISSGVMTFLFILTAFTYTIGKPYGTNFAYYDDRWIDNLADFYMTGKIE